MKPSPLRSSFTENREGLRIVIPAKRNLFLMLFIGFWMGGWAVGEFSAARQLAIGHFSFFLVFWLGAWTVGGAAALYAWLWNACGYETVSIRNKELALTRAVAFWKRSWEYDLPEVSNLRIAASAGNPWNRQSPFGEAGLAFDYGARTVRFGWGVDDAEGEQILAALRRQQKK